MEHIMTASTNAKHTHFWLSVYFFFKKKKYGGWKLSSFLDESMMNWWLQQARSFVYKEPVLVHVQENHFVFDFRQQTWNVGLKHGT